MAAKTALLKDAEKYNRKNQRRRQWRRVVMVLAAIVVFCTTYALILPAITLAQNCLIPEHTHTDACYTQQTTVEKQLLVCSAERLHTHVHTEDCYDAEGVLVCGYADFWAHTHDERCYDENDVCWCPLPEVELHTHEESCYERVLHVHTVDCITRERGALVCEISEDAVQEDGSVHTHDDCYAWNETYVCGYTDDSTELTCDKKEIILHTHQPYESEEVPGCYDATGTTLVCGFFEVQLHQHTDDCFETVEEPVDSAALTCGNTDPAHEHTERCYGVWTLTCGLEEHTHNETCVPAVEYVCGMTAHTHNEECYGEDGSFVCGLEEHTHTETCVQSDNALDERVQNVIDLIEALPTSEVIGAKLETLADDEEAYAAYWQETYVQALTVYAYYEDLEEAFREQVTNREKLFELAWLYEGHTLEITDSADVFQVNSYKEAATTLVYGGSVQNKLGTGMSFKYWDAIFVEKKADGKLYVQKYDQAEVSKSGYTPPSGGFILLLYNQKVNVTVGQEVTVNFAYTSQKTYTGTAFGTVTFGTDIVPKKDKDNTAALSTADGADTRSFIEINLFEYGENINVPYNSNKNLPGFQQEYGTWNYTATNADKDGAPKANYYNFGNNITSDLNAGINGVTSNSQAVGINKVVSSANRPVSSSYTVMSPTLGADGYPHLATGESLAYLFSDNTYAKKMNSQSINYLFQYNAAKGEYRYNSRTNHAQFDSTTDTFTLYNQLISSNYMMYPFGNFLPFNDIVYASKRSSEMDRDYLLEIANSAQYKANNGADDKYTGRTPYASLASSLKNFVNSMDNANSSGWDSTTAINNYFSKSGLPPTFTKDDISNVYTIDYDEPTDFYFGMEIKMNFIQPKNGLSGPDGDQPMYYYFAGDDDVWVYVDGRLFLDLSGIHRHVAGAIDFTHGNVYYFELSPATGDVDINNPYKVVSFAELGVDPSLLNSAGAFKNYSSHSFHFYYMERGSGSSVCCMNFNFPLMRDHSITVGKELTANGDITGVLGDPEFRFQVMKANGTEYTNEPFIGANVPYTIQTIDGTEIGSGVTGENGVFTLKAGQYAMFDQIKENAGQYYVRELFDPAIFEQYGSVSVAGSSQTVDRNVTVGSTTFTGVRSEIHDVSDGSTIFHFENQLDLSKLGSLSIQKKLTGADGEAVTLERAFTFEVKLDGATLPANTPYTVGQETRYADANGYISLKPGETAVIPKIIAGTTFTVTEVGLSGEYVVTYYQDDVQQEGACASGAVPLASQTAISVENREQGASVQIPVQKLLENPDGGERVYTLLLEQVTAQDDFTPVEPAFSRELALTVAEEPASGAFELGYVRSDYASLPHTLYYKITEKPNPDDPGTRYDEAVYIAEVTLSAGQDGAFTAELTRVWKDGETYSESNLVFVNQLVRYELPNTGGIGIYPFALAGFVLTTGAAALLLSNRRKRRKESDTP